MLAEKINKVIIIPLLLIVIASVFFFATDHSTIDFSTQVKPVINKKCITCHGGIKKEAGFSLLFREEALAKTESGKPAIIPGDPGASEFIRRLTLEDPEERMPYQHEPLSEEEIEIFRQWVKQGAKWGDHWAYVPVAQQKVPGPASYLFGLFNKNKWDWPKNNIDYFIYDELLKQELKPSPQADREILLRRVSLDLTGLLPSTSLAKQFLNSNDNGAYEKLIDSLLASPHFGERWTSLWLDIARYADTKGYERDYSRSIWRYRDWLIKAFNNDKPYNEFLTEQIAGDLLPGATDEQLIATAFHRNSMTNDEGGTDNEEYRTAAVMDRVNTTWEGLLGTTFSCVQCHSHPYDPFKHDEYYKFMAFFNNTRDEDTWADYPLLRHYENEESVKQKNIITWLTSNGFNKEAIEADIFLKTFQPSYNSQNADSLINCGIADTKWLAMRNRSRARLKDVNLDQKDKLIMPVLGFEKGGTLSIGFGKDGGELLKTISVPKTQGWQMLQIEFAEQHGIHDLYFSYSNKNIENTNRSGIMFDWFYFTKKLPGNNKPGYDNIVNNYWELVNKKVSTTPVMMDNPEFMSRSSYVFERGNWLVKGEEVQPGTPASLTPLPQGAPRNRLGLAMWLTDKKNPLTARTMVNRLWEQLFGTGIVETLEDFGTQGIEPTHRQLLDYLAYKFMNEYNWSVKKILKEIVLSATYMQDSRISKELLAKDQFNKYYARGARVRLSAEQVRDQALQVSGLLSEKMYGPGVMPWQPSNIWMSPYNGDSWKHSSGEDQYRRAVYTYWKRTAPYPSMITFDGVTRELCAPRRIRTNTPLQALVTLNDSVYIETSKHFAFNVEKNCNSKSVREKINYAYQLVLFKPLNEEKSNALENLYNEALLKFKKDSSLTCEMTGSEDNSPETAALVVVMGALLNLDEVITKS